MEHLLNKSIFSSNQDYFCRHSIVNAIDFNETLSNDELKTLLDSDKDIPKPLLYKLIHTLKSNHENKESILTVGFQLIYHLLPLLSTSDLECQTCAYITLQCLADQLDHDELVENMMDQLICMNWEYDNQIQCLGKAQLFSEYIELFGRGLEKMTKARDWMLFLPFLANNIVKTIDIIENILIEKSIYSSHASKSDPTDWDQAIILLTYACLDFIEFIHTKTVFKQPTDFPTSTNDIGSEDGDTKRRYLGYFLLNSIFEKVISNLDMQLSKTYFEKFHAMYNIQRPVSRQPKNNIENEIYKPMFDIVNRCSNLALFSGFTFDRMYSLLNSINEKDHYDITLEDRLSDDDRQMINSRLYPLNFKGIGTLVSISLYDKVIYPFAFHKKSIGLFPLDIDIELFSKKYIGIVLHLLTRSTDMICQADKGVFCLLYLSDHIKTRMTMDDIEKPIQGPCGNELFIPAARIIEIISSVASTCPDPSIRFLAYKLVEKFLDFGNDETRIFFLIELLDRCPFPSMKTASIGLLKDQINISYKKLNETKAFSIFTSPFIVTKFFPIIFNLKPNWKDEFWDDYNYIIQALNLYLYLLLKDKERNLTTVWNRDQVELMNKNYIQPLASFLTQDIKPNKDIHLQEMQIDIIKDVLEKITLKIQK